MFACRLWCYAFGVGFVTGTANQRTSFRPVRRAVFPPQSVWSLEAPLASLAVEVSFIRALARTKGPQGSVESVRRELASLALTPASGSLST
ncbi:hypothetical protein B0T22DRAFT_295820 [Podospora appendiculata]|uniref:Secreted protein n=1 Tax=Podospora appendiculata TaxID=314037 RepID=A0AAE1C8H2_9PEZI|nr:hypothetical protein B0T22DRAFT_295820 [Podospora appendiculata]